MNVYGILLLTGVCLLSACDKAKEPLEGPREDVFVNDRSFARQSSRPIAPPVAQEISAWSMAGGSASHAMAPIKTGFPLKEQWRVSIGDGSSTNARLISGPVIGEGKVFAMDVDGKVSAVDLASGAVLWQVSVFTDGSHQSFGGSLCYDQGRLYAVTASAEALAMDARDGSILWRRGTAAPVRSGLTLSNGVLYFTAINNQLEALDARTGDIVWSHTSMTESAGILGGSSVAVDSGLVIAPYTSGELSILRQDTGDLVWSESMTTIKAFDSLSSLAHIKARPLVHEGKILAISHSGTTALFDLRSGAILWSKDFGGIRSPALSKDTVFMVTTQGRLVAMDFNTGHILWSQQLPEKMDPTEEKSDRILWAGPVLVNQHLVLTGSNGQVLFCDAVTGEKVTSMNLGAPIMLSAVGAGGTLVILTDDGELVALR